ncbi:hypothetical protein Droror1_Dr00005517 [Drosera rotundifolia]
MAPQQQSKQQVQLKELGAKLESPPSSKDSLLKLLKQGAGILAEVDQSPPEPILESMQPFLKAVVKPELLKHLDKDVRLLVASCLCEITRITAPEAPYSDEILKDIFTLVVGTFNGLSDTSGPSFGRRVIILQTLARYRSCVMMLDLECDDLVREMFRTFIAVVRADHPESVLSSMKTIMVVLLEESEEITEDLLLILLSTLGQNRKDTPKAARKLVMGVLENCTVKLEPVVKQFLISSMSDDSGSSKAQIDYHDVIYDLYCCSPSILSGVVPYITGELLTDKLETRLKAVNLAGQLFSLPGSSVSKEFEQIFSEFLKRLTDRVVEVRMAVLGHIKNCLLSNPSRPEASQIFAALCDRILDYDENVRRQVVEVVCDVARSDLDSVPVDTAKLVAERLRDKSLVVKKYTMDKLADIYSQYCLRSSGGSSLKYDWIPGKILRCFYDKDFRSDAIEAILSGPLFPSEFTVQDLVNQWVKIFSGLDKVEVKAMEKILEQKQRLQQEMLRYLSLKQSHKDTDVSDLQRKTVMLFRVMSRCFTDAAKAEEGFQGLDQLKDGNIWKILSNLLDPNTTFSEGRSHRDDLLKILGEKHPLLDFLTILSMKCSYILFNKEHVKEILSAITKGADASTENIFSSMNVLVILARYSPLLLIGNEQDLLHLLKDDNEVIKEGILHVLARAGGTIRQQLASSSVDIILERLCLEGSRRQAKYAVHALAAITKDDGLLSLSVLYKRLVDMLDNKTHLPAVLQSLGCIAQTAMAVFETRENENVEFIKNKILESRNKAKSKKKRWLDRSELCLLKIYGIKTLVKSYLPVKDVHLRGGIDDLIDILRNMLQFGEISKEIETSSVDKAHLKLAAAKAVLRLSRCWDHKIPADVFHLTLRTVEINYPQARKLFLGKVHQYVKDRVLDAKYACAFLIDIVGSKRGQHDVDEHNLADIIQMCRQLRLRQLSVPSDTNSILYPEGMLPYLVHALAHHPACPAVDECKDAKAYGSIYRVLHLFLAMVVLGEEDTKANPTDQEKEILSTIISIFQRIRLSEDVVDTTKSRNSHAICELGLSITKRLGQHLEGQQVTVASVALPLMLYKPREKNGEDDAEVGEVLPWLAEDSATAHFESLKLKVNGLVHPEIVHDEIFEDSGRDGEEMPLGKLIKHIKSQKNKEKTVEKNGSTPGEIQNVVDDDILKVAREITLDGVDASVEMESNNGHNIHSSSKRDDTDNKKQKRKAQDEASVPVPKRQRSASARSPSKFSFLKSVLKSPAHSDSKEGSDSGKDEREPEGTDTSGQKSPKSPLKSQKIERADVKPSVGSSNKQKRKSVAGLAKCTSKVGNPGADLVDRRILVWWPLDKKFYGGVVKSYDPEKNKHVVLYDDLDVEVLCLDKERWELVNEGHTPNKKRQKVGESPQKGGSQDEENERSDGSRKKKSDKKSSTKKKQASTAARGDKSTSKKSVAAVKATLLSEGDNGSDFSRPTTSELDEPLSDDSKTEPEDDANKSEPGDVNEPSEAEKAEDEPKIQSPKDFDEETKPSPEIDQTKATDGGAQDIPVSDVSKSSPDEKASEAIRQDSNEVIPAKADNGSLEPSQPKLLESVDAEDADDKPLISWKRRVVKAKESR